MYFVESGLQDHRVEVCWLIVIVITCGLLKQCHVISLLMTCHGYAFCCHLGNGIAL